MPYSYIKQVQWECSYVLIYSITIYFYTQTINKVHEVDVAILAGQYITRTWSSVTEYDDGDEVNWHVTVIGIVSS